MSCRDKVVWGCFSTRAACGGDAAIVVNRVWADVPGSGPRDESAALVAGGQPHPVARM